MEWAGFCGNWVGFGAKGAYSIATDSIVLDIIA